MMRGGSFKGCGMERKEGVRRQCCVHGFARTDEAKRPQADEGLHPKRTAAQGADPREGQYMTYGPIEGARHGARGARRAKKRAWRLPTLPHRCSTIGVRALDFRVRDGNGYFHSAMATKPTQTLEPDFSDAWSGCSGRMPGQDGQYGQAVRMISTAGLCASLRLHPRPIDQIVCLVPYWLKARDVRS